MQFWYGQFNAAEFVCVSFVFAYIENNPVSLDFLLEQNENGNINFVSIVYIIEVYVYATYIRCDFYYTYRKPNRVCVCVCVIYGSHTRDSEKLTAHHSLELRWEIESISANSIGNMLLLQYAQIVIELTKWRANEIGVIVIKYQIVCSPSTMCVCGGKHWQKPTVPCCAVQNIPNQLMPNKVIFIHM